jgi:methionyl-tRNA synthetase
MGLSYDDYIRTTESRHKRGVQRFFLELQARGFIYKGTYTGQYCVSDELYVDAGPGAVCPDCGRLTETVSEENYFFKLSAFERKLLELYDAQPEFIQPESVRNEMLSFVRGGLKDLSISRSSFRWGIPVPGDEKHVIYVWLDALANYITALGYGSDDSEGGPALFAKYWPADLHLIGKEIARFHCAYWPAFLMAAGLALPKRIFANGWLLFKETKMSKSLGNVVRTETILDVLGADALRYFLLREIVFGQDGSFSFDALVGRYNADLANGYGNLVSRTLAMIMKYFDGVVPAGSANVDLETAAAQTIQTFSTRFDALEFAAALESAWALIAAVDGYITRNAPWKLASAGDESSQAQLRAILANAWETIRVVTALVYPVIPEAATKVWAQLGLGDIQQADLKHLAWGGLEPGTRLGELGPIFPRAEKDAIPRMQELEQNAALPKAEPAADNLPSPETLFTPGLDAMEDAGLAGQIVPPPQVEITASPAPAWLPPQPEITIDDFLKVDLRVAQIKVAERIPKADKLLRLEVDLGYEQRQILAGIAETYAPESLIGRKVVIVANLAPRKMRGLESNGMIVAASLGEHGKPSLAGFLDEVELGARLK